MPSVYVGVVLIMSIRFTLTAILFVTATSLSAVVNAEQRVMSFVTAAPINSDLEKITTNVLREAFKRLGYGYEVNSYPQKRCILLMKNGNVDGDATRVHV